MLVSKIEPYGTKNALKYFIGYNENDVITPLCLRLLQIAGYAKKFNENGTMSSRATNKQFLKTYNKIWKKVEKLMKINFESKPVYGDDDKYIKQKYNQTRTLWLQIFIAKKWPMKKYHASVYQSHRLDLIVSVSNLIVSPCLLLPFVAWLSMTYHFFVANLDSSLFESFPSL